MINISEETKSFIDCVNLFGHVFNPFFVDENNKLLIHLDSVINKYNYNDKVIVEAIFLMYKKFESQDVKADIEVRVMLKVRSNFSFQKKLKEPIRGKSVDYTINFTIDFNYNKHNDIYYVFDLKFILINEDRPSFPTEEEVKLYVIGRYAYLCINAMVALAKEKIKTREELDKAMKFFRRFINEDL